MSEYLMRPVTGAGRAVDRRGVAPLRHLYFWLRWYTTGSALPDGYGGRSVSDR